MTDKQVFICFIIAVVLAFIAGCLVLDAAWKFIERKKAQRMETESLRRENRRLKAVVECYESWSLKI